jgi:hypothetical protein
VFLFGFVVSLSCGPTAEATAAREVAEFLAGQAEKQGAKELVDVGGEAAIREVLEQVAKDGGEAGVESIVRLSKAYGVDAVRAARIAPRLTSTFVERIAPELVPGALRALGRAEERASVERLDVELVPGALEAAARHPGVGAQVVEKLGTPGVRASERLDTDALIRLARSAGKLAAVPLSERKGLIAAIVEFVEKHPHVIVIAATVRAAALLPPGGAGFMVSLSAYTGAVVGAFLQYKDEILGGQGEMVPGRDSTPVHVPKKGMIERLASEALGWIMPVIAGSSACGG